SAATYGGAGQFWKGSLQKFTEAKVYGVPMIAPATSAPCCDDGERRSARSGLIKGLRGEPPFDGGRFPPLLWGGQRVAAADVGFIADWIDDGCPANDHLHTIDVGALEAKLAKPVKLSEVAEFEAFATGAKRYAYREGEPRQRANLDCLSDAQVDELRDAFRTI